MHFNTFVYFCKEWKAVAHHNAMLTPTMITCLEVKLDDLESQCDKLRTHSQRQRNIPYRVFISVPLIINSFIFADELKSSPAGLQWKFSPCTSGESFHSGGRSARNTPSLRQEPRWQSHICPIPWTNLRPPHRGTVQTSWPRRTESSTPRAERSAAWLQLEFTVKKDVKEPAACFCWFLDINWKTIINHIYRLSVTTLFAW